MFGNNGMRVLMKTTQLVDGSPVWARIYFLLRAGHPDDALAYAQSSLDRLKGPERGFIGYFQAWLNSPDRRYALGCYDTRNSSC
jgi:hypothetical protein